MRQITIVGTGLIGGSLALALRQAAFPGRIVGCDRADVLEKARALGAIDDGSPDPLTAARGSDLVVLAAPVGHIIDFIERYGPVLPPETFITDVGSTKAEILARARDVFGADAPQRFLGGHPMAGKEHSGIAHADAELFRGAVWLVTPLEGQRLDAGAPAAFLELVETIGARALVMDAARHDHLCAWISHLPQMLSTAFTAALREEFGDDPKLGQIGGRALREFTRIAASPYSMWRDIALTNTAHIQDALLRLEQRLAHLRENLKTRELEQEFRRAQGLATEAQRRRENQGKS